ncbi:MAG: hypothetical protein INR71_07030, partial [Terriglobus roseus]|nr:hypothetical protein [Terriglobus roseus]
MYVLAEATPLTSLNCDSPDAGAGLWIGNATIPLSSAVCSQLLEAEMKRAPAEANGLVINDLVTDATSCIRWFVQSGPELRFYAGVPIMSPNGHVVGSFCVFDHSPRPSLSPDALDVLRDLAATALQHLESYRVRDTHRLASGMMEGLVSFASGAATSKTSRPPAEAPQGGPAATSAAPPTPPSDTIKASDEKSEVQSEPRPAEPSASTLPPPPPKDASSDATVESADHSQGTRTMFSRAANIICEICDLDGMVALDAVSVKLGRTRPQPMHATSSDSRRWSVSSAEHASPNESDGSPSADQSAAPKNPLKLCEVLGFATKARSSISGDAASTQSQSFAVRHLESLLRKNPAGAIINLTSEGDLSSTDDPELSAPETKVKPAKRDPKKLAAALLSMAPGARSIAFLPLWDYERSRWFAGLFCWTTSASRSLSPEKLLYLKVFGHSVMSELSRLDAVSSAKQK